MSASSSSTIAATFWPLNSYLPDVGVSRQPSMFIRVDFPEPDGPMIARYSFLWMSSETPAQGVDRLLAHLVELGHALDGDDQRSRRAHDARLNGCRRGSWADGLLGLRALGLRLLDLDLGAVLERAADGGVAPGDDLVADLMPGLHLDHVCPRCPSRPSAASPCAVDDEDDPLELLEVALGVRLLELWSRSLPERSLASLAFSSRARPRSSRPCRAP